MSKAELVEFMADKTGLTKADSARALDAFMEGVTKGLKKEKKVTLVGFGTFEARKRASRTGRNPQTGKEIQIPAKVVPAFSAGKKFKDAVNK